MDATRIADGKQVILKRIITSQHPDEGNIGRLFSGEPHASHVANHCIPVYDVLKTPEEDGEVLMVMPFLTPWDTPRFETVGEMVSFFKQILEVSGIDMNTEVRE